jgi:cyclopropane-fatty-acyl-phospholipid synthase
MREPAQKLTFGRRLVSRLFQTLLDSEKVRIVPGVRRDRQATADAPIQLTLPNVYWTVRILLKPDLLLGQTYVDGRWSVEPEKLFDFLHLIRSQDNSRLQSWFLISNRFHLLRDALKHRVFSVRATRAVVEHYNTDPVFMSLILGSSLSYTCAIFDEKHATLDDAQRNKLQLISSRIGLSQGQRVLDLGTGWGYAPFPLAEQLDCNVTGITISKAQVEFCETKRQESSARNRLAFFCSDYTDFSPPAAFDRVISIGMLEHVGKYQYKLFFDKVADFLDDEGVGLVHSIIEGQETSPDAWIDRNIFPGGYIPTMSEVVAGIENSKCDLIQIYTHDKAHYFKTLDYWKKNLFANRSQCESRLARIGLTGLEARKVIRIWEYFLSSSQIAFSAEFGRCKVAHFIVRKKTS